ncbi:substrate-binding domain-containing protein [Devosia pacifica]|uniref:substrate-binding domain-containing protein n=1 Tax=Devosia pacifica TaxID=1335967 RepID=UPI001671E9B3
MQDSLHLTRPDSVFCASDHMASRHLRGLAKAGVQVPNTISVVGFDMTLSRNTFRHS